ncbi:outer membrane lipoprotein Omp10 [Agrobacterium sp. rho-13.3]|uniref:outer membrane lipoprotein Omp10 n=1 Tax=Agrobacterium sp. rho-13.3 TaxID=3072980 RepID=UPI002A130EC5|nr:outer membrane lipoprotein Omp10 [Agrobacterium sp. rho-13.3]MDX8307722.1 outer membrane lipoprotein Omp10 [Agrobacterium sp. rho-13.3]
MNFKTGAALALAAIAASSCVPASQSPRPMPVAVSQGPAVDGRWIDKNGIVSTFQTGAFSTRSTDTNTLLASGTYVTISPTLYEINMTSLVRNTQSRVNCALISPSQLNCTTDTNSQFTLTRHG